MLLLLLNASVYVKVFITGTACTHTTRNCREGDAAFVLFMPPAWLMLASAANRASQPLMSVGQPLMSVGDRDH